MNLAKFSVRKPVTVFIAVFIIFVVGIMGVSFIAIDLFPEINPPVLLINTTYNGAQPEQVEDRITRPLESMLLSVSGLKELRSTSSRGSSMIILEFDWGFDLVEAANDTRDKIELVRRWLPDEAESPMIFKFDTSMIPIMYLSVSGIMGKDELRLTVKDNIVPLFEQINGVAMASLQGGQEQIVLVSAEQNRLDALGLTLSAIAQVIGSQNIDSGGGDIKEGDMTFSIKTTGEYTTLDQIAETVIMTTQSGRPVRIVDVATVDWGHKDLESAAYVDSKEALLISIQKQSGSNSVAIAENVIKALPEIAVAFPGIEITMLYDSTQMIRVTIAEVVSSLIWGILFAVLIIFLFMRNFRSMIIIGISIPISLLFTIAAMYFAGLTLNLFTLTGLILGLGMIVDSSIVILENIFRYREKGAKLESAAVLGAGEMTGAITGSTLTTVCVFLPMVLFSKDLDMIGLIMEPLAFTIIISLMTSLLVAVTLVPVMAARFPKVYSIKQRPIRFIPLKMFDRMMERLLLGLDNAYRWCLKWLINKGKISRLVSALFMLTIAALIALSSYALLSKGLNMAPEGMKDIVTLNVKTQEGTRIEVTTELLLSLQSQVEKALTEYDEEGNVIDRYYTHFLVNAGGGGGPLGSVKEHTGSIEVLLPAFAERKYNSKEVEGFFRDFFDDYPGAEFSFDSGGSGGMGSAASVDIKVMGLDLGLVMKTADDIKTLVQAEAPYVLEPTVDFDSGMPQLLVSINRQKAYEKGLNMYGIGQEILANIEGARSSVFRMDGEEYDLYVRLKEEDRSQIIDLDRVSVTSPRGQRIPLSSFADLEITTGPVEINRENQQRTAHVQGKVAPGMTATEANNNVMALIQEKMIIDSGITVTPGGDMEDMANMGQFLLIIVLFSILLVFAVMASIFENLLDPFIIFLTLFTLPIGVAFFYWITGNQLSLFSVVGMIMLVGIIVNNGIVMVDYTNLLRGRSVPLHEAAIQAGVNRLRPVLMTSLTTILGMVPMAFFPGEGSELVQPIGLTVVGGMSFSTLLTLFIVPVTYVAFDNANTRGKRLLEKIRAVFHRLLIKLHLISKDSKQIKGDERIDFEENIDEKN